MAKGCSTRLSVPAPPVHSPALCNTLTEISVRPLGRVREVGLGAERRQRRRQPPPHKAALAEARHVHRTLALRHRLYDRCCAAVHVPYDAAACGERAQRGCVAGQRLLEARHGPRAELSRVARVRVVAVRVAAEVVAAAALRGAAT